jgi:hypothetical protein
VSGVGQGVALAQRKPGSPMWWIAEYCPDLEPTHIAFPTDDASLAQIRDVATDELDERTPAEGQAFLRGVYATLRILGLEAP